MEFNQATPNAYQLIVLRRMRNKLTLTLTEAPVDHFFKEFSLISVNFRKLFGAFSQRLKVVSPEEGRLAPDVTSDFRQPGFQNFR